MKNIDRYLEILEELRTIAVRKDGLVRQEDAPELLEERRQLAQAFTNAEWEEIENVMELKAAAHERAQAIIDNAKSPEERVRDRFRELSRGFQQLAMRFIADAKVPDKADALAWGRLKKAAQHIDAAAGIHYFSAVYVDDASNWGTWIRHIQKLAADLRKLADSDDAIELGAVKDTCRYISWSYEHLGALADQLTGALDRFKTPPAAIGGEGITHNALSQGPARLAGINGSTVEKMLEPRVFNEEDFPITTKVAPFDTLFDEPPRTDQITPDGELPE